VMRHRQIPVIEQLSAITGRGAAIDIVTPATRPPGLARGCVRRSKTSRNEEHSC
jgi:hypothetical protein